MSQMTEAIVTILTAIVGVAILSVLVSKKSATADVIGSAGRAFGNSLGIAVSPVTGSNVSGLTGLGNSGGSSGGSMFGGFLNPPSITFQ